ncbi:hypothetical protein C7447_101154 [Tenacibaculum adriaticum]|uniref:Oxygen tolerance protein BatD n=1 Tax=Tenacibaculum adriaticum TaxID=413713 RepID=A0A5S5DV07_9FLAO|nr:BatD family protein [Tenacibaculum adriaticum]TYP99554.1 hypothetical protein C7447_101154 [Tenacibaculum adriaticum]
MKKLLFYISLFISAFAFSQSSIVKVEVDTTNIRIGEQFQYKMSVDETENVIIPKLENLNGLEVIDSLKIDTINNKLIRKYILTGFDSGAFYIPQQQVFIKNQAFLTDSLLINVTTVPVDTTKIKKFPIKGIKGEPYQFDDFKTILFWVLGILLFVGTVLYFALKRTQNNEVRTAEPLLAPYQEALRGLKLLDEKLLWQNNKIKQYYSELTDVIRHYIERELHVPAQETTTNGLIETLSDFNDTKSINTNKETIKKLELLLQQADLVKFAKSKPMAHEIESDRNIAENIINNLKLNITETSPEIKNIQPVIIVEKPTVKKPTVIIRVLLILLILVIVGLISYGLSKAVTLSNSLKQPITNVK